MNSKASETSEASKEGEDKKSKKKWPVVRQTRNNGKKVWLVDARTNGKGNRYFFDTKTKADTKAGELRVTRLNEGENGLAVPEKLRVEAMECARRLAPLNASLTEAVDYFIRHARPEGGERTVKQIVAEFLKAKEEANLRPEYIRVQKCVMGKFSAQFGEQKAHEVTGPEVDAWMKAQPWTLRTRRNYFKDLSNLFGFAIKKGYCGGSPLERLDEPTVDESAAPGILTPRQASALLAASVELGGRMTPFYAIGLFAGLRTAELLKIEWKDVDLKGGTLTVAPHVSKTREHRYVTISKNLKAWLLPYAKETGPIKPPAWRWHSEQARKRAKITEWPDNAMRHSFGTYHYAHGQNSARTAAEMGHRNDTRTLFSHYRALAKPKDAALYWKITPGNITPTATGKVIAFPREKAA